MGMHKNLLVDYAPHTVNMAARVIPLRHEGCKKLP